MSLTDYFHKEELKYYLLSDFELLVYICEHMFIKDHEYLQTFANKTFMFGYYGSQYRDLFLLDS